MMTDFNLSDCFRMFDLYNTGEITRFQFEEVFNLLEMYPQSIEIELAMFRYDTKNYGKWTQDEFREAILPRDKNYRDLILARKAYCTEEDFGRLTFFLDETKMLLKTVL